MTGSIDLSIHWWKGIGPDREPDLFLIRWRLGFMTIGVCRVCLLSKIHELRAVIREAVNKSEEGR